ncbi:MAG: SoxR reducing system RseC family protein [Duncaniella sp.]|nr:SoxR reducing system RseC family protein [Duncaniella sp.]
MKQDYVTHTGIITAIAPGQITLLTDGGGAGCDGCAVASLCNKTGPDKAEASMGHDHEQPKSEQLIIDTPLAATFSVGQRVEAQASSSSTLRATWWALILPTVLFIGVVLAVRLAWPGAGVWALGAAFVALAVYDFILYLNRNRLAQRLSWTVRPIF